MKNKEVNKQNDFQSAYPPVFSLLNIFSRKAFVRLNNLLLSDKSPMNCKNRHLNASLYDYDSWEAIGIMCRQGTHRYGFTNVSLAAVLSSFSCANS